MTSPLFEYSIDRIDVLDRRVPGKDKTKSLPTKSPDLAHAFILGVRHYLRQTPLEERVEPPRGEAALVWGRIQQAVDRELNPPLTNPFTRWR